MEEKALNRLKVVLAERRRTGTWLAKELGMSAVTVSKWCTNTSQPSLETLNKIAMALRVEMRELIAKEQL